MQDVTKKHASEKLDEMSLLIGYPNELLDSKLLDDYYKDLDINTGSFLQSVLSYNIFSSKRNIESLKKSVVKDEWSHSYAAATAVNAFYTPQTNTLSEFINLLKFLVDVFIFLIFGSKILHLTLSKNCQLEFYKVLFSTRSIQSS